MDAPENRYCVWHAVFTVERGKSCSKKKSTSTSCEFYVFVSKFSLKVKISEIFENLRYFFDYILLLRKIDETVLHEGYAVFNATFEKVSPVIRTDRHFELLTFKWRYIG